MQRYDLYRSCSHLSAILVPVIFRILFLRELLILLQVRVFNLSRLSGKRPVEISMEPSAVYQCHSRRIKKLAVRFHVEMTFGIWISRAWKKCYLCIASSWHRSFVICEWCSALKWAWKKFIFALYHLDLEGENDALHLSLYTNIDVL